MKFKFLKTLILIICSLFTHSRKIKRKDPLRFSAGSFLGKGTFGSVYEYTTKFSQTVFAIKFIGSNKRKFLEELSILIQICPSKTYPFTDLTQSPPTKSTVETFVLHEGQDGELFIYDNGEMELFYLVSEFKKVQDKCVGTALFSFGEKDNQYYFVFKKFDGTLKDYLAKETKNHAEVSK